MIEQVKGITIKEIKKYIDADVYYGYQDIHELAANIALKETHDTEAFTHDDGDGWTGQLTFKFKSKVEGVNDIVTTDFYGTCSFCDTLEAIYEDNDIENDLAYMVLHVMQSMSEQLEE